MFTHRHLVFWSCVLGFAVCLAMTLRHGHGWFWGAGIFGALVLLGLYDMVQKRSSVRRNYPVAA